MKPLSFFASLTVISWLAPAAALAQTYVTPKMGGGQVAADMVHIDLYYDAAGGAFLAHVDDTYGVPELRPLEAGFAFDPQKPYAVLNGKAYNSQYGWNVGGFFTIPPGAAIWIEQTQASPGLEVYENWGTLAGYAPIFGTAGSPPRWKWSGIMVHNTYAVSNSPTARLFADYHVYFGDADTGSRDAFLDLPSATVHLEWSTVPVENPLTFKFGAATPDPGAPLEFLNCEQFVTNSMFVMNLRATNALPGGVEYNWPLLLQAVPALATNGGPAVGHAALGACLELELVSLTGPAGSSLSYWEAGATQASFTLPTGAINSALRVPLSDNTSAPGDDPYGFIPDRRFTVNQPGLYCLGFRLVDASTNGPAGGPVHSPSAVYPVYLQAGLTIASWLKQGAALSATFGGNPEQNYYLEHSRVLGPAAAWETVAGPLPGTNRLESLTDNAAAERAGFYRLRAGIVSP